MLGWLGKPKPALSSAAVPAVVARKQPTSPSKSSTKGGVGGAGKREAVEFLEDSDEEDSDAQAKSLQR